jgi:hypothetical protein
LQQAAPKITLAFQLETPHSANRSAEKPPTQYQLAARIVQQFRVFRLAIRRVQQTRALIGRLRMVEKRVCFV